MKNKVTKSSSVIESDRQIDQENNCSRKRAIFTEKSVPSMEGKELGFIDDENYQDAYEKAVNVWNSITAIPILDLTPTDEPPCRPPPDPPVDESSTPLTSPVDHLTRHTSISNSCLTFDPSDQTKWSQLLEQLTKHILNLEISSELTKIERHSHEYKYISNRIKRTLFLGPPSIKRTIKGERDQIFALALKQFDNNDPGQVTLLTALYQKLTRKPASLCPRLGNHWDLIGFQGIDPISDLRGVGLLGLFQLVYFVMSPVTCELANQVYKLSVSPNNSFPFSALGMSITQITLENLRSGRLNREINRRGSPVIRTICLFYASVFLRYFKEWKNNKRTIADAGFVLEKIRKESSTKIHSAIVSILNYDQNEATNAAKIANSPDSPSQEEEGEVVFSDIWSKQNRF